MKHLLILTVGICLLLPSVPAMADQAEDEAAVRAASDKLATVYNEHDVKAYMAMCDENIENWTGRLKGRVSVGKMVSDRQKEQVKLLEEVGIVFVTPDVAIYKARYEIMGSPDADGKTLPPHKRLVARVFVKKNGKWLYSTWFTRLEQ